MLGSLDWQTGKDQKGPTKDQRGPQRLVVSSLSFGFGLFGESVRLFAVFVVSASLVSPSRCFFGECLFVSPFEGLAASLVNADLAGHVVSSLSFWWVPLWWVLLAAAFVSASFASAFFVSASFVIASFESPFEELTASLVNANLAGHVVFLVNASWVSNSRCFFCGASVVSPLEGLAVSWWMPQKSPIKETMFCKRDL